MNDHVFSVVFDVFDALVATVMDQNPIKGKMPSLIQGSCSQLFGNRTSTSRNTDSQQLPFTKSKEAKLSALIFPKLINFLDIESPKLRRNVIELIGKLVPFLKERDPLIHKVWSGLIGRLKDDKYYIVQEAFNSLSIICKVSPEFVAERISDGVIPKILVIFSNLEADLNSSLGTSGD